MNLCRLCGEEKSPLDFNIELSDKTKSNWVFRDLIEHHSRVTLNNSKLLPQSVCEECRTQIDSFAEFSARLEQVQNSFELIEAEIKPTDTQSDIPTERSTKEIKRNKEQQCFQDSVKGDSTSLPSLKLEIEYLESEGIDGEVPESAKEALSLDLWSSFLPTCTLCETSVDNLIDLDLHFKTVHSCSGTEVQCKLCALKLDKVLDYINHMTSVHAEHLKHCCLICDRIYYDLDLLMQHFSAEHPSESLITFQCLVCGEYSDSFESLQDHLTTHQQSENKGHAQNVTTRNRSKRIKEELRFESTDLNLPIVDESFDNSENERDRSPSQGECSEDEPRQKRVRLRKARTKRTNAPAKVFGSEIDSFEKLFSDEIRGVSRLQPSLHLNAPKSCILPNGEVSEEHASAFGGARWRNLLGCGICKTTYKGIDELLAHAEHEHGTRSKLFQCQECEDEFTAVCESPLINHMIERHFYEHLKFCCLVCSKMFYNLSHLIAHYKTHKTKFEVLVCLLCGWYAKTLDDLKEHKSLHLSSEKSENQELCEKVYEKFKRGQEPSGRNHCVLEEERNADGTVTAECQERFNVDWSFGRYDCSECDISFENPFQIFVHQRLKHPKDFFKKIYSCSLCTDKKEFTNLFTFVNHATTKHLDNAKFVCICCSKVFWNFLSLADHYKDVHPAFPCIFCCHCGKIFMNVSVASSHFRTLNLLRTPEERKLLKEGKILDEMSHICHVCARSFKNRGTLLNHVKIHEAIEPSELLQCHICSKFYKNKYKLAQHMVCHEDLRSWKCKACGQAFNYKKLLQRHIQAVHENERAFGCTFCEKRFNSKYDLKVHVRLHTGEMPYPCPIADCDAKYPAWSNLFKHCQSRHKLDIRSDGYKKLKATQKPQKSVEDYETD